MTVEAEGTVTITIPLSSDEERRLADHAARSGLAVTDLVRRLIERELARPAAIDEILAPFRREVEQSGLTDEELGDFFEDVRDEVWRNRPPEPPPS